MEDLITKVNEAAKLYAPYYYAIFGVDLSGVAVLDVKIYYADIAIHSIENNKGKFEEVTMAFASSHGVSLDEARKVAKEAVYRNTADLIKEKEKDVWLSFGSPSYPNAIFVRTNANNLLPPQSQIEFGTIHELAHCLKQELIPRGKFCDNYEESVLRGLAGEGFAEAISLDYVIPKIKSKGLQKEAEEHRTTLLTICHAAKGKLNPERFVNLYGESFIFRNSLAYSLFHNINLQHGFGGMLAAVKELPKMEDYNASLNVTCRNNPKF